MKRKLFVFACVAAIFSFIACDPIEDESLRNKYMNNNEIPISVEELTSYLTVTQPGPTNEIVIVSNSRPELGGVWHFSTPTGDDILKSDKGTYSFTANGVFDVYMVAPSAGKLVESNHFKITVTDVFDPWIGTLTGAKDRDDKTAKKTWGFRPVTGAGKDTENPEDPEGYICAQSAYGFWKWYAPTTVDGQDWGGKQTYAAAGDQRMVFEYDGAKMTTYDAEHNVMKTGAIAVNHNSPDPAGPYAGPGTVAMGTLTATAPVIGAELGKYGIPTSSVEFLILELTDTHLTLYQYANYPGPDWDDNGWIVYYKQKEF